MAFGSKTEKEPTVPLSLYQDLLAKYHEATQTIATMRQAGFVPLGKVKVQPGEPEPETVAVRRAEHQAASELAKHFEALGAPPGAAREEAERIFAEMETPFMQAT